MINNYSFLICVSLPAKVAWVQLQKCLWVYVINTITERRKIRIYFFSGRFENCAFLVTSESKRYEILIWYHWRYECISLSSFLQLDSQNVEHLTWNRITHLTSLSLTFASTRPHRTSTGPQKITNFFPHEKVLREAFFVEHHAQDVRRLPCGHIQILPK